MLCHSATKESVTCQVTEFVEDIFCFKYLFSGILRWSYSNIQLSCQCVTFTLIFLLLSQNKQLITDAFAQMLNLFFVYCVNNYLYYSVYELQLKYFDQSYECSVAAICTFNVFVYACVCTDCECDQRGTVPNTQCDHVSRRCQCKVSLCKLFLL